MIRCLLLLLAPILLVEVAAKENPADDAQIKKDKEKLQGSWTPVLGAWDGGTTPWMELKDMKLEFKDDDLVLKNGSQTSSVFARVGNDKVPASRPVLQHITAHGTDGKLQDLVVQFEIDPGKTPKQLDFKIRDQRLPGIYALQGESLKICIAMDQTRPKEMSAAAKVVLLECSKEKPRTPENDERLRAAIAKDRGKLQGKWTVAKGRYDDAPLSDKDLKDFELVFTEDKLKWKEGNAALSFDILLDPTAKPAALDLIVSEGPAKGHKLQGRYLLEGDRLTIHLPWCCAIQRPNTLEIDKNGMYDASLTLERAK